MAITFTEKRKKTRLMIAILASLVLAALAIVWQGFFAEFSPSTSSAGKSGESFVTPRKRINFEILKHPIFDTLTPLEKIPPLSGEPGRDNPFLPY